MFECYMKATYYMIFPVTCSSKIFLYFKKYMYTYIYKVFVWFSSWYHLCTPALVRHNWQINIVYIEGFWLNVYMYKYKYEIHTYTYIITIELIVVFFFTQCIIWNSSMFICYLNFIILNCINWPQFTY